ncbi:hypothetical protein GCM10009665_35550 [Kitasatospora nipponensis]|uniref:Uncharacterized protein n=1 Tax=Kitasatospora nipponensis TaxID=258049 RepID=A0ABN1W9R5_9ACTN
MSKRTERQGPRRLRSAAVLVLAATAMAGVMYALPAGQAAADGLAAPPTGSLRLAPDHRMYPGAGQRRPARPPAHDGSGAGRGPKAPGRPAIGVGARPGARTARVTAAAHSRPHAITDPPTGYGSCCTVADRDGVRPRAAR